MTTLPTEESYIDSIQKAEEVYGMLYQEVNSRIRIRKATEEALKECNLFGKYVTDVQDTCSVYEIHISGIINTQQKNRLADAITEKLNCNRDWVKIFAFCN